ncbi:hypothetical protein HR060_05155 [Catenovulum sp. SM1970]|uniref:hypothetical protein n=1 Tax=Marinifaba aquimaris TaxID=2741323 RepID=UPI001571D286|nr:hypothetical protein [Marinifaba aquimaris]NTS76250.1 hypothetical protein [Marinifaba aquimaris]
MFNKKFAVLILSLFALTACNKSVRPTNQDEKPEVKLSYSVKSCIKKAYGQDALQNLEQVTKLYCGKQRLTSLAWVEHLPNLETLSVQSNRLVDLSTLSAAPKLLSINIADNKKLVSLDGLENAPLLTEIHCSGCTALTNINAVANNKALKRFSMIRGGLNDISALSELDNLEDLNFFANQIQNVEALANKPSLKHLVLAHNPIQDFSPLYSNTHLDSVTIGSNTKAHCQALDELSRVLKEGAQVGYFDICYR